MEPERIRDILPRTLRNMGIEPETDEHGNYIGIRRSQSPLPFAEEFGIQSYEGESMQDTQSYNGVSGDPFQSRLSFEPSRTTKK